MSFIVVVTLSPDPEETFTVGPFKTRWDAEDFIYEAHEPTDDPCEIETHLQPSDVDYASVVFINPPPKEYQ